MEFYLLITSLGFFPATTRSTKVSSNRNTSNVNVWTNNIGVIKKSGVILSGISDNFLILVNQYFTNELIDTYVT